MYLFPILLLLPLLIGGIFALINSNAVNNATEKVEAWARRVKEKNSLKDHWFRRFILKPILWTNIKFFDWTDGFKHRGVKSGTRVTATLYILAVWGFILYIAFMAALMIAICAFILYVIFQAVENKNESTKYDHRHEKYDDEEDITDYAGLKGKKIYSGTNWLNEDLKGRIDDEGNIYKGTNWLNEEKIGRIDGEGNIYEGTNLFNENKVGRIDKEGNVQKGTNWFNEEKTGRVDEEGNIMNGTNWLNEEKKGRIKD